MLDQLAQVGCVSVNFTGGEPPLRPDLGQLVAHACDRGLFPILLTNGLLLRSRLDALRADPPGMLIVSVDSVQPHAYQAMRGVPLAPVLDGIDAVLGLPEAQRPVVTVTSVITRQNLDHLGLIVDHFAERGVGVKFTPYHHHGPRRSDRSSPTDRDAYQAAISRMIERAGAEGPVLNSPAYLEGFVPFVFDKRALPAGYRCLCGYSTLYIDAALNVRSCWSQGLPVAGSLQDRPLRELLSSRRMGSMRRRIRQLRCESCWLLCTGELSLRWQ